MAESSDLDRQIEQLKKCEIIKEAEVKALCAKAREILIEESNVQRVDSPVTVIISISCKEWLDCQKQSIKYIKAYTLCFFFRFAEISMDSFMIWRNYSK